MKTLVAMTLAAGMTLSVYGQALLTDISTYEASVIDGASGGVLASGGPWMWQDLAPQELAGNIEGVERSIVVKCRNAAGNAIFGGTILGAALTAPSSPVVPTGDPLVLIPEGEFVMGDSYSTDPYRTDVPSHTVSTRAYYMDTTEIPMVLWDSVFNWATNHGYGFGEAATGTDADYPVINVSWYDCVKWCNARSEKEGYAPVYFVDDTKTVVYRQGELDLSASQVNWHGRGYRLPTEAEWEKAARGGLVQNYFPWPSPGPANESIYLDKTKANYSADGATPVASFPANAYGLFDMAGNVREWCWDYWDWYYNFSDPTGPALGTERVIRGGGFTSGSLDLRCSARDFSMGPSGVDPTVGFRCVRSYQPYPSVPPPVSGVSLVFVPNHGAVSVFLNGQSLIGELLMVPMEDDPGVPVPRTVAIDIMPWSSKNLFNVRSDEWLPVAILGSVELDVRLIDPATIRLATVVPVCYVVTHSRSNGYRNLVAFFPDRKVASLLPGAVDGEVVGLELTGALKDGSLIKGTDSITLQVKNGKKKEHCKPHNRRDEKKPNKGPEKKPNKKDCSI